MRYPTLVAAALLASAAGQTAHAQSQEDRVNGIAQLFGDATVVAGPALVDCTLSRGTRTTCFSITVKAGPAIHAAGPWCPRNVQDGAERGGIWLEGGRVHDVDGAFIANLSTFYDDDGWQMFDPATGEINVTDTREACEAAARPDVDEAYRNHCVECLPEYIGEDASMTYVIPLEPQRTWRTNPTRGGAGVALNGVRLDGPAPDDAILGAHTIAPFDDCGGHVNPHVGYHYHAVTDCLNDDAPDNGHAARIGIAMDGHPIFAHLLADGTPPQDLDKCNGHEAEGMGYHYHAGEAGSNAILGCLKAEAGCAMEDPDRPCDASAVRPRP